jgi:hypothetical protein
LWLEKSHKSKGRDNRIVLQDWVGKAFISTVFIGLDMAWPRGIHHKPLLWETMVFGGKFDGHQDRYDSLDDAIVGQLKAVEMVKTGVRE